jgi:TonB family protein
MKLLLLCLFATTSLAAFSQNKRTLFFDAEGLQTSEQNAVFFGEIVEEADHLDLTVHSIQAGNIICKQQLKNSDKSTPVGLQLFYYEDGQLKDSVFYDDSALLYSYHYYPDGGLHAHFVSNKNPKKVISEGFDEMGNKIKDFILWKDAEFSAGYSGWLKYIARNIPPYFTELGRIDTIVTAKIGFVVNELGRTVDVNIMKSSGYEKIDKNALQIVRNSQPWKNATLFNTPVASYHTETFEYNLNGRVSMRSQRSVTPSLQNVGATLLLTHFLKDKKNPFPVGTRTYFLLPFKL